MQDKGELVALNVTLGITDNRNTEIVAGELKPGDQIAIGEMQANDKPKAAGTPPMRMF